MLKYIVLFKFRDPEACLPTVIEKLHGMMGKIPQIRSMETGADIWHNEARSYDLALICTFEDRAAFDAYQTHPVHLPVKARMHEVREGSVACDFTV